METELLLVSEVCKADRLSSASKGEFYTDYGRG